MLKIVILFFVIVEALTLFSPASLVQKLSLEDLSSLRNSEHVWLVQFYTTTSKACEKFVGEYEEIARALRGVVKVAAFDATNHQGLLDGHSDSDLPLLRIYSSHLTEPTFYKGEKILNKVVDHLFQVIHAKILSQIAKRDLTNQVMDLTDETFDDLVLNSKEMWLVEFYTSWCEHCKILAPEFSATAKFLQGKARFGSIDAMLYPSVPHRLGVIDFPTIMYFPPDDKSKYHPVDYGGALTSEDIVNWVYAKYYEQLDGIAIVQITDEESLRNTCEIAPLCVISFMPDIEDCDSICRNEYLNTLKRVSAEFKTKGWGWMWSEAGVQDEIEHILGIKGLGYPTLAAVNVKKMKYSLLHGSFTEKAITDFLKTVQYGRGSSYPIKAKRMPTINVVEAWDKYNDEDTFEKVMWKDEL